MEGLLIEEEGPIQQPPILDSENEVKSDNKRGVEEEIKANTDPSATEPKRDDQ